jgi:hypothetical protein
VLTRTPGVSRIDDALPRERREMMAVTWSSTHPAPLAATAELKRAVDAHLPDLAFFTSIQRAAIIVCTSVTPR